MRHHDFVTAAHRVADVSTDLFGFAPVMTQCGNCPTVIPLTEAVVSTFHITERMTEVEHFCSNKCAEEWWNAFRAKDD